MRPFGSLVGQCTAQQYQEFVIPILPSFQPISQRYLEKYCAIWLYLPSHHISHNFSSFTPLSSQTPGNTRLTLSHTPPDSSYSSDSPSPPSTHDADPHTSQPPPSSRAKPGSLRTLSQCRRPRSWRRARCAGSRLSRRPRRRGGPGALGRSL